MGRLRRFDLRFDDAEQEARFKASLEPELLGQALIACAITCVGTIVHGFGLGSRATTGNVVDALKWQIIICQQCIWTLAALTCGALIAVRVRLGWLCSWDWERIISAALIYGASMVIAGQKDHLTRMLGEDPSLVWPADACNQHWGVAGLNIITTATCFFLSIRCTISWMVPCTGLMTYITVCSIVGEVDYESTVMMLSLITLSLLSWHGASRIERHLRSEWSAIQEVQKQQLSIESQQLSIESQQLSIESSKRQLEQKELEITQATVLTKCLQRVATNFCDTVVTLDADLKLQHPDDSQADFFQQDVEGLCFITLLREADQSRFLDCLSRASASQLLECLPLTLHRKHATSEINVLLLDCGSSPLQYMVGIRVERDYPYAASPIDVIGASAQSSQKQHKVDSNEVGFSILEAARMYTPSLSGSASPDEPVSPCRQDREHPRQSRKPTFVDPPDGADEEIEVPGGAGDGSVQLPGVVSRAEPSGVKSSSGAVPERSLRTWSSRSSAAAAAACTGAAGNTIVGSGASCSSSWRARSEEEEAPAAADTVVSVVPVPDSPQRSTRQMRSIDENSMSYFSFTSHALQGARVNVPRPTCVKARSKTIRMILRRWYVPRNSTSCCHFHTAVQQGYEALDYLLEEPCQPLFSCLSEQCRNCFSMNAGPKCMICHHIASPEVIT